MSKLYLVRHAEPVLKGLLLGRTDPDLTPEGEREAARIELPHVALIYSSELKRARSTADRMAQGRPVVVLPELNEISYGEWDGLSWEQIEASDPELARAKLVNWTAVTPPNGESWRDFEARVHDALRRIRLGPLPAAVVAHTATNSILSSELGGPFFLRFTQQYCQVLEYAL